MVSRPNRQYPIVSEIIMKPLYCLEEVDTANQLLRLPRAWVEKLKEFLICRNILVPSVLVIR